jgi:acetyltransferase
VKPWATKDGAEVIIRAIRPDDEPLMVKFHATLSEKSEAEFAVIISDRWQNRGLGSELLRQLLQVGRARKLARITADILPENLDMQRVCRKLGFQLEFERSERVIKAHIDW